MSKFVIMLKGGKALPPGTRRQYGNVWFKKDGSGNWVYDGMVNPKGAGRKSIGAVSTGVSGASVGVAGVSGSGSSGVSVKPVVDDSKQSMGAAVSGFVGLDTDKVSRNFKYEDMQIVSKKEIDSLIFETTRRDRYTDGQKVRYFGNMHRDYKGKFGEIVAMGKAGAAMVKMSDGKIIDSKWSSLRPEGFIKPYSLYDGLGEGNVIKYSGKIKDKLDVMLYKNIGKSKFNYIDLCKEFKKRGFSLLIVGGTVRDVVQGKDSNDIDFVVDCTDNELAQTLTEINSEWMKNPVRNDHIGLVSFTDGNDTVDITPIHKFSKELGGTAKGWNLKQDAVARDFTVNTLQIDPLRGIMIDATGQGIDDIKNNTLRFCDTSILKNVPRYVLRAFKFLGRGYSTVAETDAAIKDNLSNLYAIRYGRREQFLKFQIAAKDGKAGLDKFKESFKKYDDKTYWDDFMEAPFNSVYQNY